MNEFNEYKSTNEYLVGELIIARKTNDLMEQNNERLVKLLNKAIADLKASYDLLNQLQKCVDDLTDVVTKQVTKMIKR